MEGDKTRQGRWCYAPSQVGDPHVLNHGSRRPPMATPAATGLDQATPQQPTPCLALELGVHPWTLGFTTGAAPRPRERRRPAGALHVRHEESARATPRVG